MATALGAWGEEYEVADPIETTEATATENSEQVISELKPTEVTPEIAAETTTANENETVITESATQVEPTAAEVKEVIKEVEKIVEKYPEMDDYTKELFDALLAGEEDKLLDYLSEKHRNYVTMSDYDAIKANLRKSNPAWSDEELDLKIEVQYGEITKIDTSKLDAVSAEYEEAELHNKLVDRNLKLLRLDAIEARQSLEAGKKEVKFPKIQNTQVETKVEQPTAEEIEVQKKSWETLVETEIPNVKEFTFKVGDKDSGYEDVSFKVTDADRAEQTAFLKNLDLQKMVARLGWVDDKGKQNIQKMAGDVLKLEKMQQIISSAYTQGKTTGTKGTVVEIKNIDLNNKTQTSVASTQPDIGDLLFGHLNPK